MGGAVDSIDEWGGGDELIGDGTEERGEVAGIIARGIEPGFTLRGVEHDGHAVVDGLHHCIGLGGHDCAGFEFKAVGRAPAFPNAREAEGALITALE